MGNRNNVRSLGAVLCFYSNISALFLLLETRYVDRAKGRKDACSTAVPSPLGGPGSSRLSDH